MADVRPFKGLRYNPQIVGELSEIICPPFDTISPELQSSLYRRSPYNVVRLESGERFASDGPGDNRYIRGASLYSKWKEDHVLVQEAEPAFYLVRHGFRIRGKEMSRLELMVCVRLEDYQRRVVLPHEFTRDEDKRDRLALMKACRANFSPIMCLYRDNEKRLSPIFDDTMSRAHLMEFSDPGEQKYTVWKIDGGVSGAEISEVMSSASLYIADGHHRYETALTYRDLRVENGDESPAANAAFNFVMMGLIEFDDPGLMVLPYNRAIGGLDLSDLDRVHARLRELFTLEPFPGQGQVGLQEFQDEIERRGSDTLAMGLLDSSVGGFQLLTLKDSIDPSAWGQGPIADSEAWLLEEQVLAPVLGDGLADYVAYIHDGVEAEQRVKSGEYQLGFFLKPFPLGLFERVVDGGQRLPPKSTFYYPKLPSGLVINPLEGRL